MSDGPGSTVPRRMLGRQLRQLREAAKVSVAEASRTIEVSPQTMWRLEGGQSVKVKDLYIKALGELYQAGEDDIVALLGLVKESKNSGWWHAYGDAVPTYFDLYLGLEEAARQLTTLHLTLLPGLLQTPEYRRAVIWGAYPGMATQDVEKRIEIATKRQERLRESPKKFSARVFVGESALRYRIGGAPVMHGQLQHLWNLAALPTVTLRVVPLSTESPVPLTAGSFTLMEFPAHPAGRFTEPPVVYVEGFTGALYLDKYSEIDQYKSAIRSIRSVALTEQDTRDLVMEMAKEYE